MRKRVLSLCMAFALCLSLLPVPAWAQETADAVQAVEASDESGTTPENSAASADADETEATAELAAVDDWTCVVRNGVATISKYNGSASNVTTPTSVTISGRSYPPRAIDADAFRGNVSIQKVVISEGITSIGNNAFEGCIALTSVSIPKTATKLGNCVFKNCTHLNSVTINGDLDDCSKYSMSSDSNQYSVFYNAGTNSKTFTVKFGSSVQFIPAYLFATGEDESNNVYAHVTSVSIPNSVTEMGAYAFYACHDLTSIQIGKGLTKTGDYAFARASALESVTLGSAMTYLGAGTFSECSSLKEVTLNSKLTTIDRYAFENCHSLSTITIPQSVTKLGNGAFKHCTNLSSVTINGNLADCDQGSASASKDASWNCSVFYNAGTNVKAFSVEFGSSVTNIPAYLFATGLKKSENAYAHVTSVKIPDKLAGIGAYAFYNCYDLATVYYGTKGVNDTPEAFQKAVTIKEGNDNLLKAKFSPLVIPVEKIFFDKSEVTLEVGESVTLTASYLPPDANCVIKYSTSFSCVSISRNGLSMTVTGKSVGEGTVSLVTTNGKEAKCNVKVVPAVPVESVSLNKHELSLGVGESETLIATVLPENASDESVTWKSSNTSVATVSSSGKVTAKEEGQATITVTTKDGGKTDSCTVTVGDLDIPVESVSLDKTALSLKVGDSATLTATIYPPNASDKSLTWTLNKSVSAFFSSTSLSSDQTKLKFVVKQATDAVITVRTANGKTASCTVEVIGIPVESVSLDKHELTLGIGESEKLTETVLPDNATDKSVTWKSSDESIVEVSSDGKVTRKAAGEATITVTTNDGGKTAACTVSNAPLPTSTQIKVKENAPSLPGDTVEVPVTIINNPGIAGATLTVSYDKDVLTLLESKKGAVFEKGTFTDYSDIDVVQWYDTADTTDNGELFTLFFKVKETAKEGASTVSVKLRDDIAANLTKADFSNVTAQFIPGSVTVTAGLLGDVMKDGVVATSDVIKLARAVAGKITLDDTERKLGDVVPDGQIATSDVVKLARYVAGAIPTLQSAATATLSDGKSAVIETAVVKASPGDTVRVPVSITENPGIAGATLEISYPEGLTLKDIIRGDIISMGTFSSYPDTGTAQWYYDKENVTATGVLFTLEFEVSPSAAAGEYAVGVALKGGLAANFCDVDFVNVAVEFRDGAVKVEKTPDDPPPDDDVPVINAVSKNGAVVTADMVCNNTKTQAFCAIYSESGQFIAVMEVEPIAGASTYDFTFDTDQFDYAKVFLLDSKNYFPLCESKRSGT